MKILYKCFLRVKKRNFQGETDDFSLLVMLVMESVCGLRRQVPGHTWIGEDGDNIFNSVYAGNKFSLGPWSPP